VFFVSVASKELRVKLSGLESTLAGISISVDSKWLSRANGQSSVTPRGSPISEYYADLPTD
jgi:hypothetical protein